MHSYSHSRIDEARVSAYKIPTDAPESDGTFEWNSTTLVLVELRSGDYWGLGYTYGHASLCGLIEELLQKCVKKTLVQNAPKTWLDLIDQVRNEGQVGGTAMAISAIDIALWDLKAQCLKISLSELLGRVRETVPVYGSGGFTSYSSEQLQTQFENWKRDGISRFKMKVGRNSKEDIGRVRFARECIGNEAELFVDANGAYDLPTALAMSDVFAKSGVTWFEQPIDPTDYNGMRHLRMRLPHGMSLATGEYIYDFQGVLDQLETDSGDFLQLDVTRCKGLTGYLKSAATCEIYHMPISSHCAPSLHVALGCALPGFRHIEYFHDHQQIEELFFDGTPKPVHGQLSPTDHPGLGLRFKPDAAKRYLIA
jgi:L-alanine-DL-glutamate epimerase-like enolase superfamily enzyme